MADGDIVMDKDKAKLSIFTYTNIAFWANNVSVICVKISKC